MEEISSKLLLVINTINKGNAETHKLLRAIIEEVQTSNRNQNNVVEQVLQSISNNSRGGSRTAATSKMERFVIIVNGWKPLTIITKHSILDVATVLDPPLNSTGIRTATQEEFQGVENRNIEKGKIDTNANKIKQYMSTRWKNTLNSRKQAFFQYYKAKNIREIFTELLKENPPKMRRKFLPKVIPNENKEKTAIRQ